jgi:hypothetical protein
MPSTSIRRRRVSALRECDLCKTLKHHVRVSRILGKPICPACYVRLIRRWRPCSRCGKLGLPTIKTDDGSICKRCYRTEVLLASCARCHELRRVFRRERVGPVCETCSDRHYSVRMTCSRCGRRLPIKGRPTGKPICGACYRSSVQPKRPCGICGQSRIVAIRLAARGICSRCYFQVTHTGTCTLCHTTKRLLGSEVGPACLKCLREHSLMLTPPIAKARIAAPSERAS